MSETEIGNGGDGCDEHSCRGQPAACTCVYYEVQVDCRILEFLALS